MDLKLKKKNKNHSNNPKNPQYDLEKYEETKLSNEKINNLNLFSLKNINFVTPNVVDRSFNTDKLLSNDEDKLMSIVDKKYLDKENNSKEIEEQSKLIINIRIENYQELKNERKFIFEVLKLIRNLTIYFQEDEENLELNLNTLQIFVDNYFFNESEILKNKVRKSFSLFKKNNDISSEVDISENALSIKINKRFIMILILILIFIGLFINLQIINGDSYREIYLFSDFAQYTITLKSYYSLISASLLSVYLIKRNIEAPAYYVYMNEKIPNVYYDNSIEYQIGRVKLRSALYMQKFYNFRNIYSKYTSTILSDQNVLNENINIKMISADWHFYNYSMSFYQNLNLFHLYTNSVSKDDIENMKLDVFNNLYGNQTKSANKADINIYLYIENTVDPIISSFLRLIYINFNRINEIIISSQMKNFYFTLFSCLLCVILLSIEMILILNNYNIIFIKLNIITNYIKIFHEIILEKIEVINEIMDDFVLEGCENESLSIKSVPTENLSYND